MLLLRCLEAFSLWLMLTHILRLGKNLFEHKPKGHMSNLIHDRLAPMALDI